MAVNARLDASLQALLTLKPPGVTKSSIASIAALCNENVQSESVIVQRIYTHMKRTPSTHKLGVLYVVDSVMRDWKDKAVADGQNVADGANAEGTFAAGAARITELLPNMMGDVIRTVSYEHLDKVLKLVDIWERGYIFPSTLTEDFKMKLRARMDQVSATPSETSSAQQTAPSAGVSQAAVALHHTGPAAGPSQIAAASHHTANSAGPSQVAVTLPPSQRNAAQILSGLTTGGTTSNALVPATTTTNTVLPTPQAATNPLTAGGVTLLPSSGSTNPAYIITLDQLRAVLPPGSETNADLVTLYIGVMQRLVDLNVDQSMWAAILAELHNAPTAVEAPSAPQEQTRRTRSRSPARASASGASESRDAYPRPYRERSPLGMRLDPDFFTQALSTQPPAPKWTSFNANLPPGCIEVYSRTLFIGGVIDITEVKMHEIFSQYGEVQTCIVDHNKQHAFIKMCTRAGALTGRHARENDKSNIDIQLRIRTIKWGVGFGPRECGDYQTGVSIIPIAKLTEADKRWLLTARYGGTGGIPITPGLVVEEPDIEVGAGLSSKAMSRRNEPQGRRGRNSSRSSNPQRNADQQGEPSRQQQRRQQSNPRQDSPARFDGPPQPVPNFASNASGGLCNHVQDNHPQNNTQAPPAATGSGNGGPSNNNLPNPNQQTTGAPGANNQCQDPRRYQGQYGSFGRN